MNKPDLRIVRHMPAQSPGRSKQDYETPMDFMEAIVTRFGVVPETDLAATDENAKCRHYVTAEQNSLHRACEWDDFAKYGSAFLNPPFGSILPWAHKCAEARKLQIFFLVPASVGSAWWARYVHLAADRVLFLRQRLEFDGQLCTRRKGNKSICGHDRASHAVPAALRGYRDAAGWAWCDGACQVSGCACLGYKKDPYPKDCALVVYNAYPSGHSVSEVAAREIGPQYECWSWK